MNMITLNLTFCWNNYQYRKNIRKSRSNTAQFTKFNLRYPVQKYTAIFNYETFNMITERLMTELQSINTETEKNPF